jgi:AAA domain
MDEKTRAEIAALATLAADKGQQVKGVPNNVVRPSIFNRPLASRHRIADAITGAPQDTEQPSPGLQPGPQPGAEPGAQSSQPSPQGILANLRWHDDVAKIEPPRELIKNTLPETGVALLSGQWGTGKTFVALDMGVSVARRMPFANQKCKRSGGVLYLAAEGAAQIPIRLKALKLKYPSDMFRVPMPFAWLDYCPPFVAPKNGFSLTQFAHAVAEEMPKRHNVPLVLIIIDTLAAAANFKDANDAAEAQKVMNMLNDISKETKALVLPVDHFGKNAEAGTRGSSAKEAAADAVIACLNKRTQEGRVSDFRIAVRKLRGGPAGTETPYELTEVPLGKDEDGDDITSCTIKWSPVTIPPEAPKAKSAEWPKGAFRQALLTALGGQPTVPADRVKAEFNKLQSPDKSPDARRMAFGRSWDTAVERRLITVHEMNGATFVGLRAALTPSPAGAAR